MVPLELAAMLGGAHLPGRGGAFFRGHADGEANGGRSEKVVHLMRSRHRKRDVRFALRRSQPEAAALGARHDLLRRDVRGRGPSKLDDPSAVARGDRRHARIVGVGHEGPSGLSPSRISALASAMASSERKNWRCAAATSRIAATSGSKLRESFERSPGSESPISPTIHSGLRGRLTIDIGKPIWLFWLPGVFSTAKRRERIAAVKSLVVVFPADPVIAARRNPIFRLRVEANRRNPDTGSPTRTTGTASGRSRGPALGEQRPGSARGRLLRIVVAVDASTADGDEEIARLDLARIDGHSRKLRRARGGRAERGRELAEGEVHRFAASSAAILRSSNGISTEPTTWVVS